MNLQNFSGLKTKINKVLWIIISWIVINILMFFSDYLLYAELGHFPDDFDFLTFFLTFILAGIIAGILGGSTIVFIMENWLRSKPYGWALLYIVLTYFLVSTLISFIVAFILFSVQSTPIVPDMNVIENVFAYFTSPMYIRGTFSWLILTLGTMIVLMVNDKYGPGLFLDFLKGKYFQPRKEERIFMFLDLRSSTAIAEKLGEEQYFNFLKKVFADITPSIIYSKGEIYQYVGDEIVISWKVKEGKQKALCLKCFYQIRETLEREKTKYEEQFGAFPDFKAGLHYGNVVAGEIGVVKRDITFSGDVLNTTARIQSKCNEFGVNILLSKYLLEKLSLAPSDYFPKKIGDLLLRGKENKMALYTI